MSLLPRASRRPPPETPTAMTRRRMLLQCGNGFGALALAALAQERAFGAVRGALRGGGDPRGPRPPHHPPVAKRVIFLYMDGGPSQVDTFDPKPRLEREHGRADPDEGPRDAVRQRRRGAAIALEVPPARGQRRTRERAVPACGGVRRSPGLHPLHGVAVLRAHQRELLLAHRSRTAGTAEHRVVVDLRARQRRAGSAGLHRAQRRIDSARRTRQLQQRLLARDLPGLGVPPGSAPGREHPADREDSRAAAEQARPARGAGPRCARSPRRARRPSSRRSRTTSWRFACREPCPS